MYEQKLISDAEFESARAAYTTTKADVEASKQSVIGAQFTVQSLEAGLREARKNLTRTEIFAPVNGVVSKLSVEKGEIFGFLGANGAGKTTAIRVMCGLLLPTSGEVRIAGMDFSNGKDDIKRKVGYMSQKFTLYDDMTVLENLDFKTSMRKIPVSLAKERQERVFDFIGFKTGRNTMVRDLPTGIKQQVSLAATLLHDPEILFLDEPTSGVSPAVRSRFWALIRTLAAGGKTVFVTTHYMDEAEECGRIALMRAGKLIALDSPRDLEQNTFPSGLTAAGKKPTLEDVFIKLVEGTER